MISAKPLRIRLDKIDGFIRVYDGTRYLVLLGLTKYDAIYRRIKYHIGVKNGITYVSHYYVKIKVDSYGSLPIQKTLTLHIVLIYIEQFLIKIKITTTIKYS